MKLLCINDGIVGGGAHTFARDACALLAQHGSRVDFVYGIGGPEARDGLPDIQVPGLKVLHVSDLGSSAAEAYRQQTFVTCTLGDGRILRAVSLLAQEGAYDAIYLMNLHQFFSIRLVDSLRQVFDGPILFQYNDNDFFCLRKYNYIDEQNRACRECLADPDSAVRQGCWRAAGVDYFTASIANRRDGYYSRALAAIDIFLVTSDGSREILRLMGVTGDRIVSIHNPVDPSRFQPGPVGEAFVFYGMPIPPKGIEVLARALSLARVRAFHLYGLLDNPPWRQMIERISAVRGIPMEFRADITWRNGLFERAAAARAVVVPSQWDAPSELIVGEAASMGRALIVSHYAARTPLVVPEENALVFPARDYEALAERMSRLAADRTLSERMGRRSREIAEAELSPRRWNETFTEAANKAFRQAKTTRPGTSLQKAAGGVSPSSSAAEWTVCPDSRRERAKPAVREDEGRFRREEPEGAKDGRILVSVIVSTYNAERFLRGCLENVMAQTLRDSLEVIVIDSGSRQGERGIVDEFQATHTNIRYLRTEKRETIYAAWNRGIRVASGRYVTNWNTDDRRRPHALERMVEVLEANPDKVLAYADQDLVREVEGERKVAGQIRYGYFLRDRLLQREAAVGSQPVWRRSVHEECGYFDPGFFCAGDDEFWLRLTQRYDFVHLEEILGDHLERGDSAQKTSERSGLHRLESSILYRCYTWAQEEGTTVGTTGISEHPVFSGWPEVRLWKRVVEQALRGGTFEIGQEVRRVEDRRSSATPALSVVVSGRPDGESVARTIEGLRRQTERSFEIIVVGSPGAEGGGAIQPAEIQARTCLLELREDFGLALARNAALPHTRAPVVAFLDESVVPRDDFAQAVLSHFGHDGIDALRGRVVPEGRRPAPFSLDPGSEAQPAACDLPGVMVFRREVFERVGPFDGEVGAYEGTEICYRVFTAAGQDVHRTMYFPDVVCFENADQPEWDSRSECVRRRAAERLLIGKHGAGIMPYMELMDGTYPRKGGDAAVRRLIWFSESSRERCPEKALRYAEEALRLDPASPQAFFALGAANFQQGYVEEAQGRLERAVSLLEERLIRSPEADRSGAGAVVSGYYLSASTKLASCYAALGRTEEAGLVYRKVLENRWLCMKPEHRQAIERLMAEMPVSAA